MYDGTLLYAMFLAHTYKEDDVNDLGFDPRVCLLFLSDSAIGRSIVYGVLCLV